MSEAATGERAGSGTQVSNARTADTSHVAATLARAVYDDTVFTILAAEADDATRLKRLEGVMRELEPVNS